MVNLSIIPPGWQEHHRPAAESTMTALVTITRAGERDTFDPTNAAEVLVVETRARVQQHNQSPARELGEHVQNVRPYLVTVPLADGANVHTRDTVTVTGYMPGYMPGHTADPAMIGQRFTVTHVQRGSLQWERDLICEIQPNT